MISDPDRSPCGAGTGTLMTLMQNRGNLGIDENFSNKSITGTKMSVFLSEGKTLKAVKTTIPNILSDS